MARLGIRLLTVVAALVAFDTSCSTDRAGPPAAPVVGPVAVRLPGSHADPMQTANDQVGPASSQYFVATDDQGQQIVITALPRVGGGGAAADSP